MEENNQSPQFTLTSNFSHLLLNLSGLYNYLFRRATAVCCVLLHIFSLPIFYNTSFNGNPRKKEKIFLKLIKTFKKSENSQFFYLGYLNNKVIQPYSNLIIKRMNYRNFKENASSKSLSAFNIYVARTVEIYSENAAFIFLNMVPLCCFQTDSLVLPTIWDFYS